MVDFKSLLQSPADSISAPKALPAGSYNGTIVGHEFGESAQKKTPYVRYQLKVSSGIDIDPADLTGIDMSKKTLRKDFYLTQDAAYRLKDFLESVGVPTKGRSLGECIPDAQSSSVIVEVTQRQSQDGKDTYNDVGDVKGQ